MLFRSRFISVLFGTFCMGILLLLFLPGTPVAELRTFEEPAVIVLLLLAGGGIAYGVARLHAYRRTQALLKKSQEMQQFLNQVIQAFARTIEIKDVRTRGHSARVAMYATAIAKEMGFSDEKVSMIHNMGMLHDVGKIIIPDHILMKPSALTEEEYAIIRRHAEAGSEILHEITHFPEIALGAKYHHERCDGTGYPEGVLGKDIPLEARIIAVADVFDAMNSARPYRASMGKEFIQNELRLAAGSQLDPEIVAIMLHLIDDNNWVE